MALSSPYVFVCCFFSTPPSNFVSVCVASSVSQVGSFLRTHLMNSGSIFRFIGPKWFTGDQWIISLFTRKRLMNGVVHLQPGRQRDHFLLFGLRCLFLPLFIYYLLCVRTSCWYRDLWTILENDAFLSWSQALDCPLFFSCCAWPWAQQKGCSMLPCHWFAR